MYVLKWNFPLLNLASRVQCILCTPLLRRSWLFPFLTDLPSVRSPRCQCYDDFKRLPRILIALILVVDPSLCTLILVYLNTAALLENCIRYPNGSILLLDTTWFAKIKMCQCTHPNRLIPGLNNIKISFFSGSTLQIAQLYEILKQNLFHVQHH